jgi:Glycoside hydrolase family 44/Divergent InlB B-repeat domain
MKLSRKASPQFCGFVSLSLLALFITACGGGSGGGNTTPPPSKQAPTVTVTPGAQSVTMIQSLSVTVTVSGANGTPTGSVVLSSGSYTSAAATLVNGSASISIPAGALAAGADTLSASYTPDSAGSANYLSATGSGSVTVNKLTPTVSVTPSLPSITTVQTFTVGVTVSGGAGAPTPTGSVTLTSGAYTSAAATLTSGVAMITVPAGSLAAGTATLTASYTPDAAGSATFAAAGGTGSVAVSKATPAVTVTPASPTITTAQSLSVTVAVSDGGGNPTPTGSVTLSSGSYSSSATTLANGSAQITIPANTLTVGNDTLTASYTPDSAGSAIYNSAAGTGSVTVTSPTAYTLTVDSAAPASGITVVASPADNNGKTTGASPFTLTYNGGTQVTLTVALTDDSYTFVSWTGCTSASSTTCNLTLTANTAVTANYNESTITGITVTPTTATIGTQQQFTAHVAGTGTYSSAVTWSMMPTSGAGSISSTGLYNTPYPAPATVTITATSTQNTSVSGSATVTLSPPATATGPALSVDVNTPATPSENPHIIGPYVYGMNAYVLDTASEKIANPGILRWGGDDTSRYNYQNNMTNSASDYYFENFLGGGGQFPNATGSTNFTQYVQQTDLLGVAALGTVPVNGWVSNSTEYACSFTQSQFPSQQSFESGCGNGVLTSGTDLNGNSGTSPSQIPAITSISTPPPCTATTSTDPTCTPIPAPGSVTSSWADGTWSGGWVHSIVTASGYGNGASGKGVAVWDLDNEPTWWDAVHRDVHPSPFTYDEDTNNSIGTALAIKTADPTALVSGPVIDYWWAYFYSKKDIENGWNSGPCYAPWSGPTDRTAHNGVPMIEYYLSQFNSYSQQYGTRLLDYVDIHGYFAPAYSFALSGCVINGAPATTVAFCPAGDTPEQIVRMNGTRVFWDPTYTDPNYPQPNYITDSNYTSSCSTPVQAPQLIPMLKAWVNGTAPLGNPNYDYPGTKTAIDEYNFGGLESINGAIVEADILGIFGRQGLDMGAFWPTTNYAQQGPGNYAFAMYRNYDGDNSVFGNTYLYATSTGTSGDGEGQLAVYAGQRTTDSAITVMVINKTYGSLTSTISLQNFAAASGTNAQVFQYSNANLTAIASQPAVGVTPPAGSGTTSTISNYSFPAQSITLFVIPD